MARLIGRMFLIVLGYGLACLAASAFFHLLVLGGMNLTADEEQLLAVTSFLTVPGAAVAAGYHMAVPAAVLVALAEMATIRDWIWHALGGALAAVAGAFMAYDPARLQQDTGLLATVIACGLVAGIAYWLVAGRGSGGWSETLNGQASSGS